MVLTELEDLMPCICLARRHAAHHEYLFSLTLFLVIGFLCCSARPVSAADEATPVKPTASSKPVTVAQPVVVLQLPRESEHPCQKLLIREVLRQAFLMSAREEFHAATRDVLLRETFEKKNPQSYVFRMQVESPEFFDVQPELQAIEAPQKPKPWKSAFQGWEEKQLEETLKRAEKWSRTEFVEWMKSADVPIAKVPLGEEPEFDPEEAASLEFVSQIRMIRKLHAILLHQPTSPEPLSRLVEHYALLGSLTEIHWGGESKVFQARSLLYAERAVNMHPKDARLAWSRSLAQALCGRLDLALKEIERAKSLDQPKAVPGWASGLEKFAKWDDAGLAKCVENEEPLAAYLRFLAMEMVGTQSQRIRAVNDVMRSSPECFRAAFVMSNEAQIGLQRSIGGTQFNQFLSAFPGDLQLMNHLPQNVLKSIDSFPEELVEPTAAINHTVTLLEELRKPSSNWQNEPSLSLLATLAQNLHFIHAMQILQTQEWSLGINTATMHPLFKSLLKDHPAREFVEVFDNDWSRVQTAYRASLPALMSLPVTQSAWRLNRRLSWYQVREQNALIELIRAERDDVLPDLLARLQDNRSEGEIQGTLRIVGKLSPDCPGLIVASIQKDWSHAREKAREWEEKFPTSAVLEELSKKYEFTARTNPEDRQSAERCLQKLVEIEPSYHSYELLAAHYKNMGDMDQWEKVNLKSLDLTSFGLDEARVHYNLADWYMQNQNYAKARPHALAAADSYSAWGLMCGSRCLEGLQEWEESEKLVHANSERYDNAWLEWYLWCQRTGHGDIEAARALCYKSISTLSAPVRKYSEEAAIFYILEGSSDEAIEILKNLSAQKDPHGYWGMHLLLAWNQAPAAERKPLVEKWINRPGMLINTLLIEQIDRSADSRVPAFSAADANFCFNYGALSGDATNTAYFIAKALLQKDREEEAIEWLQKAASSPATNKWNCVMANVELRLRGIEVLPKRTAELDEREANAVKLINSAIQYRARNERDLALEAIEEAVAAAPDSTLAQYSLAQAFVRAKRLPEADQIYSKLLDKMPDQPFFLSARGKIREDLNDLPGAKTDYEAALQLVPNLKTVQDRLKTAKFRRSIDDPKSRSSK